MKIEHEIKKVGKLSKIIVKLKDDEDRPFNGTVSIIIYSPDGLETIYLPSDTYDENDGVKSIYTGNMDMPSSLVAKTGDGVYQVVYAPSADGKHEGVVVILEEKKIENYKFSFNI